MIKFESVVIDSKIKYQSTGLVFELNESNLNVVYCQNQGILNDLFSIATGFYKPYLGSVIYDDINFSELNLFEKSEFLKKKVAIISDFSNYEKNLTVYNFIKNQLLILDASISHIHELTLNWIERYNLTLFKNTKIKELSYDEILVLFEIQLKLNNAQYVIFNDIEKILVSKPIKKKFEYLVCKLLEDKKTVVVFTSIFLSATFETIKKVNEINVDTLPPGGKTYLIRDKKPLHDFSFSLKNFLLQSLLVLKNNWVFIIIWFLMSTSLFIFLVTGISISGASTNIVQNTPTTDKPEYAPSLFDSLPFVIFMGITNLCYSFISSLIFYVKNKNMIYFMTRRGNGVVKTSLIFSFYVFLNALVACLLSLFLPIILETSTRIKFNWTAIVIFMLLYIFVSICFYASVFIYGNRKIVKKKDNLV